MPSQIFTRGPTTPQMNITPLIDVVFLLIIFFMLVNNIISEQSVQMIVPQLDEPTTRQMLDDQGRIIVNIAPAEFANKERLENPLLFDGEARFIRVGLQTFASDDLQGVTAALVEARSMYPDAEVVLRSDGALYYGVVQPVMGAITRAGIDTINLAAYMPERGAATVLIGE